MKYLKALVYYLRDISVNTIPSLDLIFNIVKDLYEKWNKITEDPKYEIFLEKLKNEFFKMPFL